MPLIQVINGVKSLGLLPQVVPQAPEFFRSFVKQATCNGCFALQSVCLVILLVLCMFWTVNPQGSLNVDTEQCYMPAWGSHSFFFLFFGRLIEFVRM